MVISKILYSIIRFSNRLVSATFALCILGMALLSTMAPAWATGLYDLPSLPPADRVFDQADILSRLTEGHLNGTLTEVATKAGTDVHVVTVRRLDYEETVDSLAKALFESWFPTPEEAKNQILLVLDSVTNTSAIRTGEAVKTVLSDAIATSIAQENLLVPIRQGNYNQGFMDAGDRLVAILSGQPDPGAPVVADVVNTEGTFATAEETQQNQTSALVWVIGLLVAATVIPMATYYLYLYLQSR